MRPMSSPYLTIVSPFLSGFSATLWPIGMSCLAASLVVVSVSVTTPSMSVPENRLWVGTPITSFIVMPSVASTASCSTRPVVWAL